MNCDKCPLNVDSGNYQSRLFSGMPAHARALFTCNNEVCLDNSHRTLLQSRDICSRDLWVLAFIGQKDLFAIENATEVLDSLVAGGHAELLCILFENADYETRRSLWLRMTRFYPERLYLFDSLFERECLPPLANSPDQTDLHFYQYYMLFGADSSQRSHNDL
jgi:hypothetical protein